MTLKINKNSNYFAMPLEVVDDESLAQKHLTSNLKFLVEQINQTIILGQKNLGGKTIIVGWREYILHPTISATKYCLG